MASKNLIKACRTAPMARRPQLQVHCETELTESRFQATISTCQRPNRNHLEYTPDIWEAHNTIKSSTHPCRSARLEQGQWGFGKNLPKYLPKYPAPTLRTTWFQTTLAEENLPKL
ncbi:unnamed protein product [Prunus armeniaca]